MADRFVFPTGFLWGPPPRRTRSRGATGTTTGGRGSRTPARSASSRAGTRSTTTTGTARTSRCWPGWGSTLPVQPGVVADRAGGRRALPVPPCCTTGAWCEACLGAGRPIVTLHHFTTPRWSPGGGGPADAVDRFAGTRPGPGGARRRRRGCTLNEPNIIATMGPAPWACSLRAGATWAARRRRQAAGLVEPPRAGHRPTAGLPVGLTLAMQDRQAVDDGEERRAARLLRNYEDVYLDAARATTSSACRPTRASSSVPGGRSRWPTGPRRPRWATSSTPRPSAPTIRRAHADRRDPRARHRERHRHRRRHETGRVHPAGAASASGPASTTASPCSATRTGRRSTTSSGRTGTGPRSASSPSIAPRSSGPPPSALYLGAIARANAIPARA